MQNQRKCHQNVWILSGTADGPILARKFLEYDYSVFISVVSHKAGNVYPIHNSLRIFTGKLNNDCEIRKFIHNHQINFVVDATHPFAINISLILKKACQVIGLPIFKFRRISENKSEGKIISDFKDIKADEIRNKNILLAVGSRALDEFACFYTNLGANVFARIIATPESISRGLSSCVSNSKLAILNPSYPRKNNLESYLCNYWEIDFILCRDSGGYSQKVWDEICLSSNIKLFLLMRPDLCESKLVFSNYDDLIRGIINFNNIK